jgi:thiamine kinase-like enzyme
VDRIFSAIQPLADLPVRRGLGHWDPRFANVIQRPDGHITLVDWEDSGLLDPASGIACLLTHPNQEDLLTAAQWSAFLRPYLATRSQVDPILSQRLELWCGGFSIFWLGQLLVEGVARHRTGRLDRWRVNDMPANLRLRRYLARALAWPESDLAPRLTQLAGLTFFDA